MGRFLYVYGTVYNYHSKFPYGGEEYAGEVLALPAASAFRFLRRRLSYLIFLPRWERLW
jgi:hypothetical protein